MRDMTEPVPPWTSDQHASFLNQVKGDRFQALWCLIATTDLTIPVLTKLRRYEVDLEGHCLRALAVRSTGDARRRSADESTWALEPSTYDALRRHVVTWERDRQTTFPDARHLFLRTDGRRVADDDVETMFQIHCLRANVPAVRLTPTAATCQPDIPAPGQRNVARAPAGGRPGSRHSVLSVSPLPRNL